MDDAALKDLLACIPAGSRLRGVQGEVLAQALSTLGALIADELISFLREDEDESF